MANLDEMVREFAHIQEGLEAQQAQQRAGQRLEVPARVVGASESCKNFVKS